MVPAYARPSCAKIRVIPSFFARMNFIDFLRERMRAVENHEPRCIFAVRPSRKTRGRIGHPVLREASFRSLTNYSFIYHIRQFALANMRLGSLENGNAPKQI